MTAFTSALRSAARFLAVLCAFVLVTAACSSTTATTTSTTDAPDASDTATDSNDASTSGTADTEAEPTAAPAMDDEPESASEPEPDEPETTTDPSDDGDTEAEPEPEPETMTDDEPSDDASAATSTAGFASDDDFCRVARELDENDPFEDADLDPFSPEFFDAARELYDGLLAIAPDEISGDVELVRDELLTIGEQLAAIDYDFTDPAFGEVMETLDSGAVDGAALRIEAYLRDVCGIDVDAVDEVDANDIPDLGLDEDALAGLSEIGPEEAAMLLGSLNLDPELQACLLERLPELTASQDPAILTQEICGTTLLEVVSGLTG